MCISLGISFLELLWFLALILWQSWVAFGTVGTVIVVVYSEIFNIDLDSLWCLSISYMDKYRLTFKNLFHSIYRSDCKEMLSFTSRKTFNSIQLICRHSNTHAFVLVLTCLLTRLLQFSFPFDSFYNHFL